MRELPQVFWLMVNVSRSRRANVALARLKRNRLFPAPVRVVAAVAMALVTSAGADWPTYRGDLQRSGSIDAALDVGRLTETWTWEASAAPQPAWPGPARWDAYAAIRDLGSMRAYDEVIHPVMVGDAVFVATTTEDAVYRLDRQTGERVWAFIAGGPIRVAPMVVQGKVYFGADDGRAYCVDAESGALIWRTEPFDGHRWVMNNGRFISSLPVRTGVLVRDGLAYFAASLMPWEDSYLVCVDAETGEAQGPGTFVRHMEKGSSVSLEAAMLATDTKLIAPQGRIPPVLLDRTTGETIGQLAGGGGSFVLLTPDEHVIHGPGNKTGWLTDSAAESRETIATFPKGNAVVVVEDTAYLLAAGSLSAVSRSDQTVLWTIETTADLEVIRSGDALICGGTNVVAAFDRADGGLLWQGDIEGRAKGLAIAHQTLLVGTDRGRVHAFTPTADVAFEAQTTVAEVAALPAVAAAAPWQHAQTHSRFIFQSTDGSGDPNVTRFPNLVGVDRTSGLIAKVQGRGQLEAFRGVHGLRMQDPCTGLEVSNDLPNAGLPTDGITVMVWARIDEAINWGGLVSAFQDNGNDEHGWVLGYRDDKPSFGLAAMEGPGSMTYLTSETAFEPGRWHHFAGTYDGETLKVYLDGRLVASSNEQRGAIRYPGEGVLHVGAYRDVNEYFPLRGALHEVTIVGEAMQPGQIVAHRRRMMDRFPREAAAVAPSTPDTSGLAVAAEATRDHIVPGLPRHPCLRFTGADQAVVTYETDRPVATRLRLRAPHRGAAADAPYEIIESRGARTQHRVVLTDLAQRGVYHFALDTTGQDDWTRDFECDTHFNFFSTAPRHLMTVDASVRERAAAILASRQEGVEAALQDRAAAGDAASTTTGTIVLWRGEADLAAALVAEGWRTVIVEPDVDLVDTRRRELFELGVMGRWAQVLAAPDPADPRLPVCYGDVVYGEREDLPRAARGWVKPGHGILIQETDGERIATTRAPLPGAGVWTDMYGRPDNSAFGGESLAGVSRNDELDLQWFGEPGPRHQSDRGNRKPAPLSVDGRLYVQGLHQVIGVDAFDGTILWNWDMPGFVRFNVPRDCGNWTCDEDQVFLAVEDQAVILDGRTGDLVRRLDVPLPRPSSNVLGDEVVDGLAPEIARDAGQWFWGYIARSGDRLVGSTVRADAPFVQWWGPEHWYDAKDGEHAAKICSDQLFSLDPTTGEVAWRYQRGVIVNATITIADGRIMFLENIDPVVKGADTRRVGPELWTDALRLVALDEVTGERLYDQPVKPDPAITNIAVAYSEGRYVMAGSDAGNFGIYTYDATTGESLWERRLAWETDHHGKHLSRPAIQNGRIILRPYVLALADGSELPLSFPDGHQCGTYTLTTQAAFLRAGTLSMWDLTDNHRTQWARVRPDCWISTIPANGLVLSPEGGGGCSCGSWMESSMAFLPRAHRTMP